MNYDPNGTATVGDSITQRGRRDPEHPRWSRQQRRLIERRMVTTQRPGTGQLQTSQCSCGTTFGALTTRRAIIARKDHQRETGHR